MTPFSHTYGSYNVESTINLFFKNNLGTSVPTWMTWRTERPRTLNFDYPDESLSTPSFAIVHRGSEVETVSEGDRADGTNLGQRQRGTMEVNCWVSTKGNNSWMRQLRDMRDMVYKLIQSNREITLQDFTNSASPTALSALVRFTRIRETPVVFGHNPALQRKQILVTYTWMERWT